MRPLKDGYMRVIKPGAQACAAVEVAAHREDADTPWVRLKVNGQVLNLTDVACQELIGRLQNALSILPSSK